LYCLFNWQGGEQMEPKSDWEFFPHLGDVGIRGFGLTKEAAFENAARAMTATITDPASVTANVDIEIECRAADDETLLVDWLNALVFEMAVRGMLFRDFRVTLGNGQLTALARGEPIDPDRHAPRVEVKGATYTCLRVTREGERWLAQCVLDV
jgi:tRNA nucleotidyltransferase (CCA-adding enzyme)